MTLVPYYEDRGITIYCSDALAVLEQLDAPEVHAIVFDPPYASGTRAEAKRSTSGSMLRGSRWANKPIANDQMTTAGFVWLIRELLLDLGQRLVDGGSVLSFIDWRQWPNLVGATESCNLRVQTQVVWDKLKIGMGNGFRNQHELVMHAAKGTPRVFDKSCPSVIGCASDSNVDHPSPKPEPLMRRLIEVVTDRGELIIDPTMGCGATLRAAQKCGRRAIGIELEERYCEIAAELLSQHELFA